MPKSKVLESIDLGERKTVSIKVPARLLERFDYIAKHNDFARGEAVKQAMRDFIQKYSEVKRTPEEEMQESAKTLTSFFSILIKSIQEHPELKKLAQQSQLPDKVQKDA